ncbi:MAG TPA: glycosyltransferase N-terminal domain-containing protein [Gemmatimonadaceae bacterium]|nr:glycosyltransferase N-terminal domain-containing protein [Gemmatimonadaceae bacterium]
MNALLRALYRSAGLLARSAVLTGAPGDGKLARTINGRRGLRRRYAAFARDGRDPARPLVWFHAPSVGEGLQATPVMARLRSRQPDLQLAYTHFSPSAAAFAGRTGADFADYLPFDTAGDMRFALSALRPSAIVFSKLDVWPVLVEEALRQRVPVGMISATLSQSSGRRSGIAAAVTRDAYAALDAVGAIDAADAARLVEIGVRESVIRVTGDTRYDQVWARAQAVPQTAPWLHRFRAEPRLTLVAGSTWPADEVVLLDAWRRLATERPGTLRLIIAPHEPTAAHITPIESWAAGIGLRSARLDAPDDARADVVLVDRTGVLGDLYALADVAYVGGGFHDAGLHSVLEPAAFSVPVLFGPRHRASRDARLLLAAGGATSAPDGAAMLATLSHLLSASDGEERRETGARALRVVQQGLGAADASTGLVLSLLA